jgi:ABC-type phosphonate transport system ATPase subunit
VPLSSYLDDIRHPSRDGRRHFRPRSRTPKLPDEPAVVLGDEPTGAVDSETSAHLLAVMRAMNRDHGVVFVIVTHDLELAGRVVVDETARVPLAV